MTSMRRLRGATTSTRRPFASRVRLRCRSADGSTAKTLDTAGSAVPREGHRQSTRPERVAAEEPGQASRGLPGGGAAAAPSAAARALGLGLQCRTSETGRSRVVAGRSVRVGEVIVIARNVLVMMCLAFFTAGIMFAFVAGWGMEPPR